MPTFPSYESNRQLTTQQPSFLAPSSTEGQVIEKVGQAASAVPEAALKWSNAVDTIQTTTSQANFKSGVLDILQRAENDPDYNSSAKYLQEVEKLRADSLKGFSSKGAERNAAIELGYQAKVASIQLQNTFKKKIIDVGQASALKLLDLEAANPTKGYESRIASVLDQQIKDGVIGKEAAYKLQQEYMKKAKYNSFLIDMDSDPEAASKNLSKNTYGFDISELSKAKKMIESNEKRQEEARKDFQLATVNAFGEKLANRTLTSEEIQGAVINGAIDAEMASDFELALSGPEKWTSATKGASPTDTASKLFIEPLKKISEGDIDGRNKIIKAAMRNYNDKKINRDDLTFILRVSAGKSTDPTNPIWGHLKSAISWAAESPSPVGTTAAVMEKFKSRWDFKEDPREVMKQAAIDQFKEDRPETSAYKIGDTIKRKSGSYEVVGFSEEGKPLFRKK